MTTSCSAPRRVRSPPRGEISLRRPPHPPAGPRSPVVSANMDSVTDARMAVAMALEGGSVSCTGAADRGAGGRGGAGEADPGPRRRAAVLPAARSSVREARELARRHNVTGLLIEEAPGSGVLAGLLSNRDLPWSAAQDERPRRGVHDAGRAARDGPPGHLDRGGGAAMFATGVEKLPLVDGERRIHGLITKKDILAARQRPYSSKDARGRLLVGAAIGARGDFLERAAELLGAGADVLLIDIAHAPLGGDAARGGGGPRPLRRRRARVRERRARRGRRVPAGPRRGRDQGRGGAGPRMPDAARDGAPGCRSSRRSGRRGAPWRTRCRSSPTAACARTRSVPGADRGGLGRDAREHALGHRRGAGHLIEDPGTGEKRKIYRGMTSPQAVFRALYDDEEPDAVEAALEVPAEGQEMQVPYRGSRGGHPPADPRAPPLGGQLRGLGVSRPAPREGAARSPPLPRPALGRLPRRILRALNRGQTFTSRHFRPRPTLGKRREVKV